VLQNLLALARLLGPKLPLWMPVLLAIARKAPASEIIPLVLAALEGTFGTLHVAFGAAANDDDVVAVCTAAGCDSGDVSELLNAE